MNYLYSICRRNFGRLLVLPQKTQFLWISLKDFWLLACVINSLLIVQSDVGRRPVVDDRPRRRARQHGRPQYGRQLPALAAAAAPAAVLRRPHHGVAQHHTTAGLQTPKRGSAPTSVKPPRFTII